MSERDRDLKREVLKLADEVAERPEALVAILAESRRRRRWSAAIGALTALLFVSGIAWSATVLGGGEETPPVATEGRPTFARYTFDVAKGESFASGVIEADAERRSICLVHTPSDDIKAAHILDTRDYIGRGPALDTDNESRGAVVTTFYDPESEPDNVEKMEPDIYCARDVDEGIVSGLVANPDRFLIDFHRGPNDSPGLVAKLSLAGSSVEPEIVFAGQRDNFSALYGTVRGEPVVLFDDPSAIEFAPRWSPDGAKIAFAMTTGGAPNPNVEIFVIDADGSGLTRLTDHPLTDQNPAWSPDGNRIAFSRDLPGGDTELYVMDADGSNVEKLTSNETGPDGFPDWAASGDEIVYVSNVNGAVDLYTIDPSTRIPEVIWEGPGSESAPRWSPDGTRILFAGNGEDFYLLERDGDVQTRPTGLTNAEARFVAWSGEGGEIAWVARIGEGDSRAERDQSATDHVMVTTYNGDVPATTTDYGTFDEIYGLDWRWAAD